MTPPQYALFDESNHILAMTEAVLTTGLVDTPEGKRLGLTIRTSSTTLTVVLDRIEGSAWRDQLTRALTEMSEAGDDAEVPE